MKICFRAIKFSTGAIKTLTDNLKQTAEFIVIYQYTTLYNFLIK
jgi:hypothetical protein